MERRILILTCSAHFFTHLFMLVYPTIAVVQAREWALDVADLLMLSFPGFLCYGLVAVPFGAWADRAGGWLPVTAGLLGMGAGGLICAAATAPWHIAVGLGVVGIFASAYHPAGLGLITHGVRRSDWALGFNGSFGSAAVAVAPGLAEVLSESLGWRGAFVCLATPALLLGAFFLTRPIHVEPDPSPAPAGARPAPTRLWSPAFAALCGVMLLGGLAYRGTSVVLPTLFDERVDFLGHGVATSMAYSFAIVMNYVGGTLTERFDAPRVYWAFHALSLPPLVFTAWLSGLPLLLLAGAYVACALGTQPAENSFVAKLTPPGRRSVAYGIKFTLAFGVGSLAVPLVSWLLRRFGTTGVQLTISGIVAALVLAAGALALRTRRERAPEPDRPAETVHA